MPEPNERWCRGRGRSITKPSGSSMTSWLILDLDPAELAGRGVDLVVHLDGHDVLELRDRPVRPVSALRAVVDRGLAPQAREVRTPGVLLVQARVCDVELLERQRLGLAPGLGHSTHAGSSPLTTSRRSSSARPPPI